MSSIFASCRPEKAKPVLSKYQTDILYYPETDTSYLFNEVIDIVRVKGDSTAYIYDYKNLKEENDTVVIKQDKLLLNGEQVKFLTEKAFPFKCRRVVVKKYLYHNRGLNNFYVIDSIGLAIWRASLHPSGQMIVCRYHANDTKNLYEAISRDSSFFAFKLFR